MRIFLLAILCFSAVHTIAQQYVYVNTDNLLLRSRPGKDYEVFLVLHAGFRLQIEPYSGSETKAQQQKFYHVAALAGGGYYGKGYVEKSYVVSQPGLITAPVTKHNDDTGMDAYRTVVAVPANVETDKGDGSNSGPHFPYPKYKGGEHYFAQPRKREYHLGPHNGCYYIDDKGHKKYVDRKYCK